MGSNLNWNNVLFQGLKEILDTDVFDATLKKLVDDAFYEVFESNEKGKLKWQRFGDFRHSFKTRATIQRLGNRGTAGVEVVLRVAVTEDGGEVAHLSIGHEPNDPTLSSTDMRVGQLYRSITGGYLRGSNNGASDGK